MLYNPDWKPNEAPPKKLKKLKKPDPFKLNTLIAWLEKQPAHKGYLYNDHTHCVLAQYFTAHGFENVHMWSCEFTYRMNAWSLDRAGHRDVSKRFSEIAYHLPHTFGWALARAKGEMNDRICD